MSEGKVNWREMARAGKKALKNKKAITSPEEMWTLACEYFEYTDNSPIESQDFVRGGKEAGSKVTLKKQKPYTWSAFESYLVRKGIITSLDKYRLNTRGQYGEFIDVMSMIGNIMRSQKFEGATAGIFNPMIISRDLGLAEKVEERSISVNANISFDYTKLSDAALEEIATQFKLETDETKMIGQNASGTDTE